MKQEPQVRRYRQEDREAVVALWSLVFTDEPLWNESNQLISRKLTVQPELFFVCEIDNQVVGTTVAGFDGVRGWVHKVAAHPDHRRKGIAARLMNAAETGLSALGCTKLNLQVRTSNSQAVAFYADAGYSEEDRVSMSKHLGA